METNYNIPKLGSFSIISRENDMLIFTDVRTQMGNYELGEPRSKIDENKGDLIRNAVQHYMEKHELDCKFHLYMGEVVLGKGKPQIRIQKNPFSVY